MHKKWFELSCKGSSGIVIIGVRAGKCGFFQVMIAGEKCAFWPIIRVLGLYGKPIINVCGR